MMTWILCLRLPLRRLRRQSSIPSSQPKQCAELTTTPFSLCLPIACATCWVNTTASLERSREYPERQPLLGRSPSGCASGKLIDLCRAASTVSAGGDIRGELEAQAGQRSRRGFPHYSLESGPAGLS